MIRLAITLLCFALPARAEVLTAVDPLDELPEGKTVVWSPLFQATWDAMNTKLGGKPVKVEPPNLLMARMDAFEWEAEKVMPAGSWKVWSGAATRNFLNKVNKEAAAITGEAEGPFKLENEAPGLACFGLLDRDVEFQKPFFRSWKVPLEFGAEKTEVSYFGVNGGYSEDYGENVKVLAYRPVDGSFALEVSCKGADDKVILYRPPLAQDFATACLWIRKWRMDFVWNAELPGTWADRLLHGDDEVRVPYVSLNVNADLTTRLQGLRFYGEGGPPWVISRAEQVTRFELHEKGARVRVETSLEVDPFGGNAGPETIPRRFIYDRPFFVFLWRAEAEWPYFGAWIGDASALQKFGE